jgi:hypothetical protein
MAVVHFLLVYDHRLQRLVGEPRQFQSGPAAAEAYAELEAAHRDDRNLEIVLVGADSIETIMRTHGHYFAAVENPFPELVSAG